MTLLLHDEKKGHNCTNRAIKYFLSGFPRQIKDTLFCIIHYYHTIIVIIYLIHIIA
jgi:hypothetical protein